MPVFKPWGSFTQYAVNRTCSVKLITMNPHQETSLHWHNLRTDLWVILDEGLKVQIGDEVHAANPGEEYTIPAEQLHRIISGDKRARVLEIAFGYSVDEDTHRLADDYGRELDIQ